jgi:Fic family protein
MRGRYERRVWASNPAIYAPPRYRRACHYDAFVPEPLAGIDLHVSAGTAGTAAAAEALIADLNRTSALALIPLARLLLRTESIASSKVEGLQVDTRALARAEAKQETGRRIGEEAREILANIDAMQLAIERATGVSAITVGDIVDVHRALLSATRGAHLAGRVRTVQNWIGGNDYNPCGADFVPPPPEHVVPLLDDLALFCNDDSLPPMMQAALAHAQFETIHPFEDGNGRTGRALVQIVLRRRGLSRNYVPPVSVVLAQDKDRYVRGLTNFREGRVGEWLEMFASASAQAASVATLYVHDVALLQDRWRERVKAHSNPRADAAVWSIIDVLPAHPIITVPVGVAATRRTKPAVTNGIATLEAAGVLKKMNQSARNRAWEADGLLDIIASLESGERI